ncbi:MAG: FtsX-like permease family protein, partial [Oscillospiraceae bacterium]|nr:FtsX-like permease family protein [Oscillospiraceae bacterium]
MKNAMGKNVRRTIRKSLGRYIAIVAIIALGAGMFVGLLGTKTDMVATAQKFTDDTNMFHLRLLSTYGWRIEDVEQVAQMEGVAEAEGSISMDAVGVFSINALGVQSEEKEEAVYRLHSIPDRISQVHLLGGRMPEAPNECLVDGSHADDSVLGTTFEISQSNEEDLLESVSVTTFTVVGYVSTPLYMDMSRGSTTLGNGDLANYIYIPLEAFCVDYYTEIGVIIQGDFEVYTDGATQAMEDMAERMEPGVTVLAQDRFLEVKDEVLIEYEDGLKEYEDGLKEFEDARQEALEELEKALKELQDGQTEIDEGLAELEDAREQLLDAQGQLEDSAQELGQAWQELADAREEADAQFDDAEAELAAKEQEVTDGLAQVRDGYLQIDDGIAQLEAGIAEVDAGIAQIDQMIASQQQILAAAQADLEAETDPEAIAQLQQQIGVAQGTIAECEAQKQQLSQKKGELSAQLDALRAQRLELEQTEKTLLEAQETIRQGYVELEASKVQAEAKFQQAQDEIIEGEAALDEAEAELGDKWTEWADGKRELAQAQEDLEKGWLDYEQAKLDVETELSEAEAELADAKAELDDALAQIEGLEEPEVFLLDRNTNVGYLAVDSNSDIVAGVSRVFPAFFLLVAALVCITTMTRMVDEERTQIGILKALGYSNGKIIGKYLVYTGSASLLGCTLGVLIGSVAFPKILWYAYSIILNLTPDIVLVLDWPLCLGVVGAYTAVSMLVTWYCCRKELKEVPAELIRPKSPAAGKKILL